MFNANAIKKHETFPDEPELIVSIPGKEIPIKITVSSLKSLLGIGTEALIEYSTAVIDIPASEILTMGSAPIFLLPSPEANEYYEWKARVEFTNGNNPYVFNNPDTILIGSSASLAGTYIPSTFITFGADKIINLTSSPQTLSASNEPMYRYLLGQEGLMLTTVNGEDPIDGDGTIRIYLQYILRTFGE